MKRLLVISMVLVSAVLLIAGCDVSTPGVTVSGMISARYMDIASPASITFTQGGDIDAVSIIIPGQDGAGYQTGTYSISNVPPGTYKIEAVFTSHNFNSFINAVYSVDSGGTLPVSLSSYVISGPDQEWTVTIDSLSISAGMTIDVSVVAPS